MTTRHGDWIQTYQGGQCYPLDPRADEIHILDIAHSLSNLCRYNGHVKQFYSVAEHCCHVSDRFISKELRLTGLMHDASEAYLCDMPRPIKRSEGFADLYLAAEDQLMTVIADVFDFQYPLPSSVGIADNRLLGTEARQLMAPLHAEWRDLYKPIEGLMLPCWAPEAAREEFLNRYADVR